MTRAISEAEKTAFAQRGFVVLESIIDAADLEMLRRECAVFVERTDAWLAKRGTDVFGITHRGKRYFISNRYRDSEYLPQFIFGETMRAVTTALLGESVYLFNEQWVVKGAEQGMKFAWHQDSGYVQFQRSRQPAQALPYLLVRLGRHVGVQRHDLGHAA